MSQWTHVRGCLELSSSVYETKTRKLSTGEHKTIFLPFPNEQIVVEIPEPYKTREEKAGLKVSVQFYALPRCQPYIDAAMKMLPSGEYDIIQYNAFQPKGRFRSSGSRLEPFAVKLAAKQLEKLYADNHMGNLNYQEMKRHWNLKFDWAEYATDITLTISDDLRYCSGEELAESLEKVIIFLQEHDIDVADGYLEWHDEWRSKYIFALRATQFTGCEFLILDANTNNVLGRRVLRYEWDTGFNTQTLFIKNSGIWDKVMTPQLEGTEVDEQNKNEA